MKHVSRLCGLLLLVAVLGLFVPANAQAAKAGSGWKEVLSAKAKTPEERLNQVEKARTLFMIEVQPALLRAGFDSAKGIAEERQHGQSYSRRSSR